MAGWRARLWWTVTRAVAVATVLAVALMALVLAIAHGLGRERLRSEIEASIEASLGVSVEIGSLRGVLYRDIEVGGLSLGPGGNGPEFTLDRAAVALPPLRELLGLAGAAVRGEEAQVELERLAVEGLTLRIVRGQSLPWESGQEAEVADDRGAVALRVGEIVLRNARIEWIDPSEPGVDFDARLDGTARAFHADAAGAGVEAIELEGGAQAGSGTDEGSRRELGELALRGGFSWSQTARELDWELRELALDGPLARIDGVGTGDAKGLRDAELRFDVPRLSDLVAELEAAGLATELPLRGERVSGSVEAEGAFEALVGELAFEAQGVVWEDRSIGQVALRMVSLEAGLAALERFEVRGSEVALRAEPGARIDTRGDGVELRSLAFDLFDPADRRDPALPGALAGRVSLSGFFPRANAQGSGLDLGDDPAFRLDVNLERLSIPLAIAVARVEVPAELAAGDLAANVELSGGESGLSVDGSAAARLEGLEVADFLVPGSDLRFSAAGPLSDLRGRFEAHAPAVSSGRSDTKLGALDAAIAFEAQPAAPGRARVRIEEFALSEAPVPITVEPGGELWVRGSRISTEGLVVSSGEQRVEATGAALLDDEGVRFDGLTVALQSLELGWLRDRLHEAGALGPAVEVEGVATGSARLDGSLPAPRVEGEIAIRGFASEGVDFEEVSFELRSPGSLLEISSVWDRNGDRESSGALVFGFQADRASLLGEPLGIFERSTTEFELRASGFDLSVLEAFSPARVDALRGHLEADVAIRGGVPARVERGHFALSSLGVRLRSPKQTIGPIDAVGTLTTGAIEIERIEIGAPGRDPELRRVVGSGRVDELGSGDEQLRGELVFDGYPIKVAGLAKGTLDGRLAVGGRTSLPRIDGGLRLSDVEVWIPQANAPELKEILVDGGSGGEGLAIRESDESGRGALDRVAWDVRIDLESGSWARGRGVEAELAGSLLLHKEARREQSYSGELRTVRGTYEVYGRRFDIERGVATLDGDSEIDPVLDIEASHRVRNVDIQALISGRLSDTLLRFESDPELSQTDIASYLLLGRPAATATGGDALAVQTTAARLAAGVVSSELDRLLTPVLPVDVIDVRVDDEEDEDALSLGFGKYIGERLFLRYDRRFGREAVDEFRAELELTDHWSVESNAATNGEAGGDLIFKIEY